jgi:hypothetical protein
MALQVGGREVLHAGAIRTPHGVLALCGVSETGKSTIAFGLSLRGHQLWADDAVAFEISSGEAMVHSLPFEIRLRPAPAEWFEVDAVSPPRDLPFRAETAPLAAVCVLRRDDGASVPVTVRRLSSAGAFAAVLAHAYCFTLQDRERKRRMMHHYLELVAKVPIFEVCFQSGLANLPEILDAIEQVLGEDPLPRVTPAGQWMVRKPN